jgi:hypothetical protein|tara:strand:+ start:286 stop:456 length:171 start_codon:yes stop_codon:yes gene_type:complete
MRRGEKSLRTKAHQEISICCETLCQKEIVEEYIAELEARILDLEIEAEEWTTINEE